jgi:hypothetical protein
MNGKWEKSKQTVEDKKEARSTNERASSELIVS